MGARALNQSTRRRRLSYLDEVLTAGRSRANDFLAKRRTKKERTTAANNVPPTPRVRYLSKRLFRRTNIPVAAIRRRCLANTRRRIALTASTYARIFVRKNAQMSIHFHVRSGRAPGFGILRGTTRKRPPSNTSPSGVLNNRVIVKLN